MGRLVLTILGWFFILGAFIVLWLASVPARVTFAGAGIGIPDWQPRDVGLSFNLLFVTGFVLVAGSLLETLTLGIARALAGGLTASEGGDLAGGVREGWNLGSKILWGAFAYCAMAFLFGLYLVFFALPGEKTLERFTDILFVEFVLTWPYQLLAAVRPFDLSPTAFH